MARALDGLIAVGAEVAPTAAGEEDMAGAVEIVDLAAAEIAGQEEAAIAGITEFHAS